jgi:transcriptional regulator with XRE-family HTH domain
MPFSDKLRNARREKKITQKELSEITGLHQKHISKYEASQKEVKPRSDIVVKLAKALGVTTDYLLTDDFVEADTAKFQDDELFALFVAADSMKPKTREIIREVVDAFLKKEKMAELMAK